MYSTINVAPQWELNLKAYAQFLQLNKIMFKQMVHITQIIQANS